MNYNRPGKNNSTIIIRVVCAIVFVMFSFAWLFFFQSDVLAMTQHVLSGGLTHYDRLTGAVIITAVLYVLQLLVYSLTRLKKRGHALTYVPSMMLLAMLTDVSLQIDQEISYIKYWWIPLSIFLIWILCVLVVAKTQKLEDDYSYSLLSRPMWINLLLMALLMIGVAWIGNTNAVFHYRMKTEGMLIRGEYGQALEVGRKSLESDEHLLMLRMYALARKDGLGEHLFDYPITGNSSQILPSASGAKMLMYPLDSLYRFLGARPVREIEPMRYLELLLQRDSIPRKAVADYLLSGYLIDKKIDRFANELGKFYHINDSLPKHYREALTLYTHLRSTPVVVYHNPVMDEDFENLMELEKQYPAKMERKGKVAEQYRGTYWYFYKYE